MTVYQSPFPPVREFSKKTAWTFLFEDRSKVNLGKTAIIDTETGKETTYGELIDESLAFGDGIRNVAGVAPGQTILIFSPNSPVYPIMLFASQAAGVICSMANAAYMPSELAHQLRESGASAILVGSDLVAVAKEAAKEVGLKEDRIYVLPGVDGKVATAGLQSYEKLRGKKSFVPVKTVERDTPAFLPFSSGTTSKPKGCIISHGNMTSTCLQLDNVPNLFNSSTDTVLGALPLSHIYGLVVLLYQTIHTGGTLALMPRFDLVQFCEAVQKYKATIALVVPPICIGLVKHPIVDKYDLSSLRFMLSGAAPLSAALQEALQARLKGPIVTQGYGMTETTSIALLPTLNDQKTGTCGKLFTNMEARLVDEEGNDVPEGEAGELWIRGPNIMVGYLNNEKATAESITPEGWFKTGDVCEIYKSEKDPSTYLYAIVDRRKELIKYKGFQVIPSELEAVLLTCPMVADAAVIGVWNEDQATELPRAYVVVESKFADDDKVCMKIGEYVKSKVASHKRLRGGVIKKEVIPKSPSGKILRKDLRTLAAKDDVVSSASKL